MRSRSLPAVLVLALPIMAGCLGVAQPAGSFSFAEALAECEPMADTTDPYPRDAIYAVYNVTLVGDRLHIAACLVNGRDRAYQEECGPARDPVFVGIWRVDDGKRVFRLGQDAWVDGCTQRTIPANSEWNLSDEGNQVRVETTWDLRHDVCPDDDEACNAGEPDEGKRVRPGDYRVRIRYPSTPADERNLTVSIPPPPPTQV